MSHNLQFLIGGAWVDPVVRRTFDVLDPSTEQPYTQISIGSAADVDAAVASARAAFATFSLTPPAERRALLKRIRAEYARRYEDIAQAVSREMGAPIGFAREAQVATGHAHLTATIAAMRGFPWQEKRGTTMVVKEPIGVCALITPWNWPLNQIVCKVAPAIAAGCTMVLKPSELAPISGMIFAEILDAAGMPAGVFNMVQGDGVSVGQFMAEHRDVDMVSFTGSTRAGVQVAKAAADTVKRVCQELGGKSPNIILADADLESAVVAGVEMCMANAGQSCDAPTRMLVLASCHSKAVAIAKRTAEAIVVGDPRADNTTMGPVVSKAQFEKIQALIEAGIQEGAELVTGGLGRPDGLGQGYYVRPTIFGDVRPGMRIEREEIFGPVLSILPYQDEEEAIRIANDTDYGLAAYVHSGDIARARAVAARLRAGTIHINSPDWDTMAPFGGYKQSGNGREYADWGIHDFLEIKGIVGYNE